MKRGQLTGGPPPTGISGTPTKEQDWTLDKTGNWTNFTTKTSGTTDLNQTRAHDPVNQIAGISETTASPVSPIWTDPLYDEAGNMTTLSHGLDPTLSYSGTYDAWNRLTKLSSGASTVAEYQYDGRGRRAVQLWRHHSS